MPRGPEIAIAPQVVVAVPPPRPPWAVSAKFRPLLDRPSLAGTVRWGGHSARNDDGAIILPTILIIPSVFTTFVRTTNIKICGGHIPTKRGPILFSNLDVRSIFVEF